MTRIGAVDPSEHNYCIVLMFSWNNFSDHPVALTQCAENGGTNGYHRLSVEGNRGMATWEQVQQNPTLYQKALFAGEGENVRWHKHADQPHSSQVFCISTFGTLRHLSVRDRVINELLGSIGILGTENLSWQIEPEFESRELLSEYGKSQPSSIDTVLKSSQAIFCVEAKFQRDAELGFGQCSQPSDQNCAGFFGPGSDLKIRTNAWCRLEVWDGNRSPRTYWTLGRAFFRDSVFARQAIGETCPFNGPNYQLMRNFVFSAAMAQHEKRPKFGVVVIAPKKTARRLEREVNVFRSTILQPQFSGLVQLVYYERLVELLRQSNDAEADSLGQFLESRIADALD